ncbi:carbohydrate-binding protein [Chitinophaga cymbidii]|uniref:CBM6 domain-containing protein n=1 Tax=Chitinophaga cymbidii TaxID=1096750 RepID=A0A512RQ11_9BACT|nr:carbohydrate-binding protein [Chitinophaga cymbidii]GEP97786.1 hypothetical protein CCY01nite_40460 [Chitinophaga cymbidii]
MAVILLSISLPARGQSSVLSVPDSVSYLMKEGAYLGFRQVNLSMGEIGFEVKVTSKLGGKSNARLEFRIDQPKGRRSKRIGTLRIPDTADTTYAIKLQGNLRHAMGVHDLYLVAKGSGEFNIIGFKFISNWWRTD